MNRKEKKKKKPLGKKVIYSKGNKLKTFRN
jgi:hypothetical protein